MNPMLGEQPQNSYRWDLQTGEGLILARTVLVDTGGENVRRIPALARAIPGRVGQHHAADYRSPGGLPEGTVLVVGSAQSGTQIAEDLLAAGRHVILSTSPVGRAPARHRGRDTLQQLVECGFFAQRARDLPDQSVLSAPQPLIAPGGRSTSLRALARAGVTLTGRLVAVDDEHVTFDRSTAANVAAGDAFATRIRVRLDEILHRSNEPAPPIEPDQADLPIELDPPLPCYSPPPAPSPRGRCPTPGLWYVALRWLTHRGSAQLPGIAKDAETVADAIAAHLTANASPPG